MHFLLAKFLRKTSCFFLDFFLQVSIFHCGRSAIHYHARACRLIIHYSFHTALALVFGFISRTAFLDLLPGGLNQDEASAGYDAYAIFKYGIDRNGIRYPVHLVAWGSGQNALYSYLYMPFLLALGVNEISLRLPMALAGCISIFLLYRLLLRRFGARTALLGMLFLVVNPWHLMKSRWALESNLFP